MKHTREQILDKLTELLRESDAPRLSFRQFNRHTRIPEREIQHHFGTWSGALKEAGAPEPGWNTRISDESLYLNLADCVRRLGRFPRVHEYSRDPDTFAPTTLGRRLTSWSKLESRLRKYLKDDPRLAQDYADVIGLLRSNGAIKPVRSRNGTAAPPPSGVPSTLSMGAQCPGHEQGVLFAFGQLAASLGYFPVRFNGNFPDAEFIRRLPDNSCRTVRIEFELFSRNFMLHNHDPKECDLIVCWEDNWPDKPKNLPVLALQPLFLKNGRKA